MPSIKRNQEITSGFLRPALILLSLTLLLASQVGAQSGLCVKTVTSSFTLDGVVAPGASATCSSDPVWPGVSPAMVQPSGAPAGYLYLAYFDPTPADPNNGDSHLLVGADIADDPDLSDFDILTLFFDANNDDSWDNGDFAIEVHVSPSPAAITSGDVCDETTGDVVYYQRSGTSWTQVGTAAAMMSTRHAYDYDVILDPESRIWNLEIDIPIGGTHFNLSTSGSFFGVGGYVFADSGHQQTPQQGTVLTWPGGLKSSVTGAVPDISQFAPQFSQPSPGDLADISLNDVCFDVNFTNSDVWWINNNTAASYDHRIDPNGSNTFRVQFLYDGPGTAVTALDNQGAVELRLRPYGNINTATSSDWIQTVSLTAPEYNKVSAAEFTYDFSSIPPTLNWGTIGVTDFVCATMNLQNFERDDDPGNNIHNVNYNYFITSESTQELVLYADSIADLGPGESGMLFLQVDMNNELPEIQQQPEMSIENFAVGPANLDFQTPGGLLIFPLAALLFLALFLHFRRSEARPAAAVALLLPLVLLLLAPKSCHKKRPVFGTDRWGVTNATEVGIQPVEGRPGWFQVPMEQGEVKRLELQFQGQPLPYQPRQVELVPVRDGRFNSFTMDVTPESIVTVIAFGEVDLDGYGPLPPTSATGFVQDPNDDVRYFLQEGYYSPNEYAGTLIGSFDSFDNSSFVVGRDASIVVPEWATTLSLAVNGPQRTYDEITGAFDLYLIETPPPGVPTHTFTGGDATHGIPQTVPIWRALTSLNVYSFYQTQSLQNGRVVGETMHPSGAAHFIIYDSHVTE